MRTPALYEGNYLSLCAFRIRLQVASETVAGGNVEPLAVNVTLCQVMVTLSLRGQNHVAVEDADWLGPIRVFIRETLSSGGKLSSRHLAALLEVVWRMIVTQRSRGETLFLIEDEVLFSNKGLLDIKCVCVCL